MRYDALDRSNATAGFSWHVYISQSKMKTFDRYQIFLLDTKSFKLRILIAKLLDLYYIQVKTRANINYTETPNNIISSHTLYSWVYSFLSLPFTKEFAVNLWVWILEYFIQFFKHATKPNW